MDTENRKKGDRSIITFAWPRLYRKAFEIAAKRVLGMDRSRGDFSEVAREVLEQFMFSILGNEESRRLGLFKLGQDEIPSPYRLRYALQQYDNHRSRLAEGDVRHGTVSEQLRIEEELNARDKPTVNKKRRPA